MLTVAFIGSSAFVLSEILKNKGHDSLAKSTPTIILGAFALWLLWELPKLLM